MRKRQIVVGVGMGCGLWMCASACQPAGSFPPPTLNMIAPVPLWLGMPYEDVTATTSQGNEIHGWFIPAADAKATILLHHGALTNRSSTFAEYALLHNLGYNVMVYDYQGFGENYNTPNLNTILPDADAALAYLQGRTGPGSDTIILFGRSLGTLPAIVQAARTPARVAGVVLEGSFVSETLPPWSLLLAGIVPWANAVDHVPTDLEPNQHIGNIVMPKVFLQSREDLITPFEGAMRLCEMASEPKQFIEITGQHLGAVSTDPAYPEHLRLAFENLVASGPVVAD